MRIFSLILLLAAAAGCARPSSTREAAVPTGILDEAQVLAIARAAVATNDTWLDRAEFEKPQRDGSGWSVNVWRLPKTPGGDRLILIDEHGSVTKYLRGL
jgi:hypothetical protein